MKTVFSELNSIFNKKKPGFFILRTNLEKGFIVDLEQWENKPSSLRILSGQLSQRLPDNPLFPISAWLLQGWKGLTQKDKNSVLEKAGFYFLHREGIRSWLEGQDFYRFDDLFRTKEELSMEQGLLWKALWRLLGILFPPTEYILLLEGLDGQNGILPEYFSKIIEMTEEHGPLLICLFHQIDSSKLTQWNSEGKRALFSYLENRGWINNQEVLSPGKRESPDQGQISANMAIQFLKYCKLFLCLSVKENLPYPKGSSKKELLEYYWNLGMLQLISEEFTSALVSLDRALPLIRKHQKAREWILILIIALAHFRKNDFSLSQKYFQLAERSFLSGKDESFFLLESARIIIFEQQWAEPEGRKIFFNILEVLEKKEANPLLWILKTTLSYYRAIMQEYSRERAIADAKHTLQLVHKQGNFFQEAKLCHMLGFLHQDIDPAKAIGYFDKNIELRILVGSQDGLIKGYNGVGYFCFSIGQYEKSLEYFQKALILLEKTEDFIEICLTLFNAAITYIMSAQFFFALELLQKILDVMEILNIEALPWHSNEKLRFLAGLCAYYLGWKTLSLDFWQSCAKEALPYESLVAFYLLKSKVDVFLGGESSSEDLNKAYDIAQEQFQGVFAGHILIERFIVARKDGRTEEKEYLAKEADSRIPKSPESGQRKLLNHVMKGGTIESYQAPKNSHLKIGAIAVNVLNLAQKEAATFTLYRRLNEMTFLKNFQERIHRDRSAFSNFKIAREVIQKEYPVVDFYVFEEYLNRTQGKRRKDALPEIIFPPRYKAQSLRSLNWKKKKFLVQEQGLKKHYFFSLFLNGTKKQYLSFTLIGKKNWLEAEEIEVIQMAMSHLSLTLEMSRAQEELKKQVIFDPLTGAYTRHEVMRLSELERQRCLRLSTKGIPRTFSLLFMDLDNFKEVNDTLGHSYGDQLLKDFCQLINKSSRDLDFLGRIGGDEFVLILPETDQEGAKNIAQRILDKLEKEGPFYNKDIFQLIQKMKDDKKPGCSIGIAEFKEEESLKNMLERADKSLYSIKKQGKNSYSVAL